MTDSTSVLGNLLWTPDGSCHQVSITDCLKQKWSLSFFRSLLLLFVESVIMLLVRCKRNSESSKNFAFNGQVLFFYQQRIRQKRHLSVFF